MKKYLNYINILVSATITAVGGFFWLLILVTTTDSGSRTIANLGIYGLLFPAAMLQILTTFTSISLSRKKKIEQAIKIVYLTPLLLVVTLPGLVMPFLFPVVSTAFFYIWFRLHTSI